MGAGGIAGAVSGGLGLLGAKMQADASKAQGEFAAQQSEFNAAMLKIQRKEIGEKAQDDIFMRQQDVSAMLGAQKATMAANGIDVDSDVSMALYDDTIVKGHQDAMAIRNNAWREAWGVSVKIADVQNAGAFARAGGLTNAWTSLATGGLNAVSSVAGGMAQDYRDAARNNAAGSGWTVPSSAPRTAGDPTSYGSSYKNIS
jgi:hypothetical protein